MSCVTVESTVFFVVSLVCGGSYAKRIVEDPSMFCLIEDSCDCLYEWGVFVKLWYLCGLRSASVIVITTILSTIFVFLPIIAVILFSDLRVHLSFSPTKQYILAELASIKIRSFFSIYVTAYFID